MYVDHRMGLTQAHRQAAMEMIAAAQSERRPLSESERVMAKAAIHQARLADAAMPTNYTADRLPAREPGLFETVGHQLAAIHTTETIGGHNDPRLTKINQAGLNTKIPSEGGFMLQETFANDLLLKIWDSSRVASWCWRIPVTQGNALKMPAIDEASRKDAARHGGTLSYWVAEGAELTPTKPKFRQIGLVLKKLAILCYTTDELLDDAPLLGTIISRLAAAELSFALDSAILNGTGAGMPLGIFNSGAVVTCDKDAQQVASTITFGNIVNLWKSILPSARAGAIWCVSPTAETELYKLALAVGDGGSAVYMPAGGMSASPYTTLLGRPVVVVEQLQELGTAGDILLANFGEGYILAERAGLKSQSSVHLRFITDETAFKFLMRVDGQPILESPVEVYSGTLAQSHFAILETRD